MGGVGIANIMAISVLERRGEIGLRRALGSTRTHIAGQFLGESLLLGTVGGAGGVLLDVAITAIYANVQGWRMRVPPVAMMGSFVTALRAANLSPTLGLTFPTPLL